MSSFDELRAKLKPYVLGWIRDVQAGAIGAHDLSGLLHTGTLADSQAPQFLKTDGSRQLTGNLSVASSVTIDGVDLSALSTDFGALLSNFNTHDGQDAVTAHGSVGAHNHQSAGAGGQIDHGLAISGLGDDDHTQYVHLSTARTITARHTFNPGSAASPFILGANAQGQLVTGLLADQLSKQVIAGNGLTGGGTLTADATLNVGAGTGISVAADTVGINLGASLTWTATQTFRTILPSASNTYDLGSTGQRWKSIFGNNLEVAILAEQIQTMVGGWFTVGKDQGTLAAAVATAATQINFGKAMTVGHVVLIRGKDQASAYKLEYVLVGSLVSGTTYNVTRDVGADNVTDPAWPADTGFLVLGASGDGRIELNAYDTPRVQVIKRTGAGGATNEIELVRIGDLTGWQAAGLTDYGWVVGNYATNQYAYYTPAAGMVVRGTINVSAGSILGTLDIDEGGKITSGPLTIDKYNFAGMFGTSIWTSYSGEEAEPATLLTASSELILGEDTVQLARIDNPTMILENYLTSSSGWTTSGWSSSSFGGSGFTGSINGISYPEGTIYRQISATVGTRYKLIVRAKQTAGGSLQAVAYINFYNASNALLSTSAFNLAYTRYSDYLSFRAISGAAPATTSYMRVYIAFQKEAPDGDATILLNHVWVLAVSGSVLTMSDTAIGMSKPVSVEGYVDGSSAYRRGGTEGYIYVPVTPFNPRDTLGNTWSAAARSAGGYVFDLQGTGNSLPAGIKAVYALIGSQWSAANAGNYLSLRPNGGVTIDIGIICRGYTAAMFYDAAGVVHVDANGDIQANLAIASGSHTLAQIIILGYFI